MKGVGSSPVAVLKLKGATGFQQPRVWASIYPLLCTLLQDEESQHKEQKATDDDARFFWTSGGPSSFKT